MSKGYTVLPIRLVSPPQLADTAAVHHLYLKRHSTTQRDPTLVDIANRSLFIVNLPFGANFESFKRFFGEISTGAIIEGVHVSSPEIDLTKLTSEMKNNTALEFGEKKEQEKFILPLNTALVTFLDTSGVDLALQSVRKLASSKRLARWPVAVSTGSKRYSSLLEETVLESEGLAERVAHDMELFAAKELDDLQELNEMKNKVDADGFTLVVGSHRKTKNGILGKLQHSRDLEKINRKMKKKEKTDFYKFQIRERKKQEMNDLLAKFKEDQERVKVMRSKREFKPY
ncbi:unnamed protein product [Kuraishia capsulata CBS 1993]|uniref:Ribosomal RNA-processing protein 7 C-terminal domain-containing protein n=1 Tax=Kuraishia capsulata CBS 1993 TaxID=1382522 RepID=W6MVS9_9ASCO|nr:uncharacterized protein KUCA_T00002457001 [Kuraishia capsulata CBS 1993]CDK26485.1 unnamed protein product [Kuraishia capsulata CBS 1993]